MAYPVALTTLMARVRRRADIESATARFPDAEIVDNINLSTARWYDLVRGTPWGGQYYRKVGPITTVAGQQLYALPSDFLALTSIDIFLNGTSSTPFTMLPYQEEQRNALASFGGGPYMAWPGRYQLQGTNLSLLAKPPGIYLINVNYVPTAPILDLVTVTSLDSINGWEEWLVLDAAVKTLQKDGDAAASERASLQAERGLEQQRIQSMAPNRDMGASECIHDVTGTPGGYFDPFGWGGC